MRIVSIFAIVVLLTPVGALSDTGSGQSQTSQYSREELAQMLAPIALYPDSLLSQVLMASTYPLEIIEADRWVKQNQGLKGDALDKALQDKTWDASVKSLCYYPQALTMLSEKIEWTSGLGNAFLGQQSDVMNTVQELRAKARDEGNLKTTQEQKVVVQEKYIAIEPANPTVVYVPAYNPAVVYGPWLYPAYPPYPYYYPGAAVVGAAIGFGAGFAVGAAVAGWSGFNWGHNNVYVNVNKTVVFNNVHNHHHDGRPPHNNNWQHNPQHRHGVAYMDKKTANKFGQSPARSLEGRRDLRGYGQTRKQGASQTQQKGFRQKGPAQKNNIGSQAGRQPGMKPSATQTQQRALSQKGAQQRSGFTGSQTGKPAGMSPSSSRSSQTQQRSFSQRGAQQKDSFFGGHGNRQSERAASNRGSFSRSSGGQGWGSKPASGGRSGGGHFRR
jgi:hypothetical protein